MAAIPEKNSRIVVATANHHPIAEENPAVVSNQVRFVIEGL